MTHLAESIGRVLIYRLGSLGDTVVALPALKLVASAFPTAQRWLLTNFNSSTKAAPMAAVLEGTGLVHGYIRYPLGLRDVGGLISLRREIRRFRPDVLVYLAAPRGRLKAWRDALFFRACGITRLIGVPYSMHQQRPAMLSKGGYEYEGIRLVRCLRPALGETRLDAPEAFDLSLSDLERRVATTALGSLADGRPLLMASVGAKVDVKDWEDRNWAALVGRLGGQLRGWGLCMVGSRDDRDRSSALLAHWPGASVNLCGSLSVRESAAVLDHAQVYVGHDSGPMHLAAAVGTPCVAIFSSRNLPGEWFPHGHHHRVHYKPVECLGCKLDVCLEKQKMCIRSISVHEVEESVLQIVNASALAPEPN